MAGWESLTHRAGQRRDRSARVRPLATVEPFPGRGTGSGTRRCHGGAGQGRRGRGRSQRGDTPGSWGQGGAGAELGASPSGRRDDPHQHLRPGQANLRLRVPQKWYLGGVLNPELFHVGERRQHLFHLQGFQKCSVPSQECPGTSFLQDVVGSRLGLSQADTSLSELQGVKGTPAGLPLLLGALSTSPGTVKPSQEKAGRLLPAKRV